MTIREKDAPIILGLAGFGTVGSGLARILQTNGELIRRRTGREIRIKTICVRDVNKPRAFEPDGDISFTTSFLDLVDDPEIDIVVEMMGGIATARELITMALEAGKHVVTANKALLAEEGQELFALAAEKQRGLYYEAAIAAAVPIVESLKKSLACNRIEKITGILNGTSNYILHKMTTKGVDFDAALADATEKGYAEADPTLDIDGFDAAHKLALLVRLGFGHHYPFHKLPVEGVRTVTSVDIEFAREFGYSIKLIGQVREQDGAIEGGIFPALVPEHYMLARVDSNFNAIRVQGDAVGPMLFYGQGAGALPTGAAVLSDVMSLVRDVNAGGVPDNTGFADDDLPVAEVLPPEDASFAWYIRLTVSDRPGVLAHIANAMRDHDISVAQVKQRDGVPGIDKDSAVAVTGVPIVFFTHAAPLSAVRGALADMDGQPFMEAAPVIYRIL